MNLWKRRPETVDDPVFGRLTRGKHNWSVESSESNATRPSIYLAGGDTVPTEAQRTAHRQLETLLAGHALEVSKALYDLYAPYLELPDWEGPRPDSAAALRTMLQLDSVTYAPDGAVELLYGFVGDAWPDAMFTVEIRNGSVRGVCLDD
jgi:hypothetical protein